MIKSRYLNSSGFTLIELLIVMMIFSIMALITFNYLGNSAGVYTMVLAQRNTDGELIDAVDRVRRESRVLRSVSEGRASSWSFLNARSQSVTVSFSGSSLLLNDRPLARGVAFCQFRYFDDANQSMGVPLNPSQRASVKRVEMDLRITNELVDVETIANFHIIEGFLR